MNPELVGETLKSTISEYVKKYDSVSYAELQRDIGATSEGDHAHLFEDMNVILWTGMSKSFAEAIKALENEGVIHSHPSVYFVYLVDGRIPRLDIAIRPPKDGYKKPHWLPVVFRPGACCSHEECPKTRESTAKP